MGRSFESGPGSRSESDKTAVPGGSIKGNVKRKYLPSELKPAEISPCIQPLGRALGTRVLRTTPTLTFVMSRSRSPCGHPHFLSEPLRTGFLPASLQIGAGCCFSFFPSPACVSDARQRSGKDMLTLIDSRKRYPAKRLLSRTATTVLSETHGL